MQEFFSKIKPSVLPVTSDEHKAEIGMERFLEATQSSESLNRFATEFASHNLGRALLSGLFGNSPFLTTCLIRDPSLLHDLVMEGPDRSIAADPGPGPDHADLPAG